jgi:hypothetical protein
MKLTNVRMNDGSRQFADLPEVISWEALRDHLAALSSAKVTGYLTDQITEAWIDFTYRGYTMSVNNQFGDYWFFVDDPSCPDPILANVVSHCERVLRTK